jgi:hypothetical protein
MGGQKPPKGASIMRCVKTVTPIKIDANRKNAKRSTGPRTHRGKSIAKFNAVTHGLFAKHVAIPICDGDNPERDFQSLLDRLHQDFQPKGFYEEWLVGKIAECMWRLRRAARCESGAVREAAMRDCRDVDTEVVMRFAGELGVLGQAAQQLRDSGTLSRKIYRQIVPLMEEGDRSSLQSEEENEPIETDFDLDLLMSRITDRMQFLDSIYKSLIHIEGRQSDARFDYNSLLPEADMERVLRYEERMHRQIDWAVQRLLESQERRKTLDSSPDAVRAPSGQMKNEANKS